MALRAGAVWAWALVGAWVAGCAPAAPDPSAPDTVEEAPPTVDEPGPASVAPLRLTVRQIQRALDALTGVALSETLPWPSEPTRRGLAGQEEVAAVSGALVDALRAEREPRARAAIASALGGFPDVVAADALLLQMALRPSRRSPLSSPSLLRSLTHSPPSWVSPRVLSSLVQRSLLVSASTPLRRV